MIYTKLGKPILPESIKIDIGCYAERELLMVWAQVQGTDALRLYYISDLKGDQPREVQDVVSAALKARTDKGRM